MRENCLSYSDIVSYFGDEKIADRYKYLYDKMTEYIRIRGLEEKLIIHEGILQQAVMDYFVDIYRMKEFHKVDRAGMSKILAYEAYWILRRKPIQLCVDAMDDRLVFANEGFVTTLLAHDFFITMSGEKISQEQEERMIAFLRHLNYHLKYRTLDKQNLEIMLMAYRTGSAG